jgi:hypothetical protein
MKRNWTATLAGLGMIAMLAGTAWAQGPISGRTSAPPPSGGFGGGGYGMGGPVTMAPQGPVVAPVVTADYDEMKRVLKLTPPQTKNIDKVIEDEGKALGQFDKEKAKTLEDLNKKLTEATQKLNDLRTANPDPNSYTTGVKAQVGGLEKQVAALKKQIDMGITQPRERLSRQYKARAMASFTAEQKLTWSSLKLEQLMTGEFASASLSAEQQAAVKAMCDNEAKTLTSPDVLANKEVQDKLKQAIQSTVLDPQQQARYAEAVRLRDAAKAGQPTP